MCDFPQRITHFFWRAYKYLSKGDGLHEGIGQSDAGVEDGATPKEINTFSIFSKSYYIS
jgi:hypothetical protein